MSTDSVTEWQFHLLFSWAISTTSCGLCKKTLLDQCFWKIKNNSFTETTRQVHFLCTFLYSLQSAGVVFIPSFYKRSILTLHCSTNSKTCLSKETVYEKMANVFLVQFLFVCNYRMIGAKCERWICNVSQDQIDTAKICSMIVLWLKLGVLIATQDVHL